jgi:hypothetical protein
MLESISFSCTTRKKRNYSITYSINDNLNKSNVSGSFSEALTAYIKVILSDNTTRIAYQN